MRGTALGLTVGSAALLMAMACVDLESLGRLRPEVDAADADASVGGPSRFCEADSGAIFCEDFDEPGAALGEAWPGLEALLPSPAKVGNVDFVRVEPSLSSSLPYAVEFSGRREEGEARPFALFGRELALRDRPNVAAIVMVADVRIQELTSLELPRDGGADSDGGDAADADDAGGDAAGDGSTDAGALDAALDAPRNPNVQDLPDLHVPTFGLVSVGAGIEGVQVMFTSADLFIIAGDAESTRARVRVARLDYLRASELAWVRLALIVGEPAVVERALRARGGRADITCPRSAAVAGLVSSLPVGAAACVEATPDFAKLSERRLAASIGIGLDIPSTARVLIDSVRVDEVR